MTMAATDGLGPWLDESWARLPDLFTVDVEGAAIACRGWNLGAGDLPGIVLVHGFRAHARWWDHIAPSLADAGYRVVALDLSGMGDSDRREAYSREGHGNEILAVAQHCGFHPVTIVAHSFGALGSLIAARSQPDRVERVIVIDSGIPTAQDGDFQIPTPPARFYPDRDSAIARFRLIPPGEWPDPRVLAHIAHHSVHETDEGWTWKFDPAAPASLNEETYREKMDGVAVPIDVIHGDRSEVMTPDRLASLRMLARDVRRTVVIPACHHHVLIERPLALVSVLRALLAR